MVVKNELAGKAQVQLVDTGQALDSRWLKDDVLTDRHALPIRYAERRDRLYWKPGVVLEVDAGAKFPRQFVGAVHLEHVGRIEIEVVVLPVDVVVWVIEVVARGLVG